MACCSGAESGLPDTLKSVQNYYGKVLSTSKDLKTSACTASGKPSPMLREIMAQIPEEILATFYGCGAPIPTGIDGLRVLDLGSGSGRDCYIASKLVGPKGTVLGIDMTEEQLEIARRHMDEYARALGQEKSNMEFRQGYIERLGDAGIADESVDMIISNCVVNLSPDKPRVLQEAWRVLAPGGELYFSDVYCDRRLPEDVQKHEVLWGECISGALYVEDFKRLARAVGFADPRALTSAPIAVTDPDLLLITGEARFYSITYRLFKLPGRLESACEDYGQVATYMGTLPGHRHAYDLDKDHRFITGKPALVCGNTASMLAETWLASHFDVAGDRSVHYGLFACAPPEVASAAAPAASAPAAGGCC